LRRELDLLKAAMSVRDRDSIQAVLGRTVEGYGPQRPIAELAGTQQAAWKPASRTLH
jgi:hypothetical protein